MPDMSQEEFRQQLETAQDTVTVLCDQRNVANNENAQLRAQILGLQRKLKEVEDKLATALTAKAEVPALANGVDKEDARPAA